MSDATHFTPDVPSELGEENAVFFTRSGHEYRITMAAPNAWVIHRRGSSENEFEIVLTHPDKARQIFDAEGRAPVHFSALGHSLSFVLANFC